MHSEFYKFWNKLDSNSKFSIVKLILAGLVVALLEAWAVSNVPIFINALKFSEQNYYRRMFEIINISESNLVISTGCILVIGFLLKSLVTTLYAKMQAVSILEIQDKFSNAILFNVLSLNSNELKSERSSEFIRKLTVDSYEIAIRVLIPMSIIIIELFTLSALLSLLVIFVPWFVIFGLAMAPAIYYANSFFAFKRVREWSIQRKKYDSKRVAFIQELFSGFKEIKLRGGLNNYLYEFKRINYLACKSSSNLHFIQQLPRVWLDTLALLLLGGYFYVQHIIYPSDDLLASIALISVAGMRVLPSVNRIINSTNDFKYGATIVDELPTIKKYNITQPAEIDGRNRINFLSLRAAGLKFGYENKLLFECLNFEISRGDVCAIVGKSGSGKSSLLDLILGFDKPKSGSIFVNNLPLNDCIDQFRSIVGYVSQDVYIYDDTLISNIAFFEPASIDYLTIEMLIDNLQLRELVERLPNGLQTIMGESGKILSGGERQRIGIARALYSNPSVLVLDEATSALDEKTELSVIQFLKSLRNKLTIVMITHRPAPLMLANKFIDFNRQEND